MENYLEMKFLSIPENVSFSRSTVSAFCLALDPSVEELNDVKTAVSEAVTNSIVHGYENRKTEIIEITIMQTFMDEVAVDSKDGETRVKLLKRFKGNDNV